MNRRKLRGWISLLPIAFITYALLHIYQQDLQRNLSSMFPAGRKQLLSVRSNHLQDATSPLLSSEVNVPLSKIENNTKNTVSSKVLSSSPSHSSGSNLVHGRTSLLNFKGYSSDEDSSGVGEVKNILLDHYDKSNLVHKRNNEPDSLNDITLELKSRNKKSDDGKYLLDTESTDDQSGLRRRSLSNEYLEHKLEKLNYSSSSQNAENYTKTQGNEAFEDKEMSGHSDSDIKQNSYISSDSERRNLYRNTKQGPFLSNSVYSKEHLGIMGSRTSISSEQNVKIKRDDSVKLLKDTDILPVKKLIENSLGGDNSKHNPTNQQSYVTSNHILSEYSNTDYDTNNIVESKISMRMQKDAIVDTNQAVKNQSVIYLAENYNPVLQDSMIISYVNSDINKMINSTNLDLAGKSELLRDVNPDIPLDDATVDDRNVYTGSKGQNSITGKRYALQPRVLPAASSEMNEIKLPPSLLDHKVKLPNATATQINASSLPGAPGAAGAPPLVSGTQPKPTNATVVKPPQESSGSGGSSTKAAGTGAETSPAKTTKPARQLPIDFLKGKVSVKDKFEPDFSTPHEELCPSNGADLKLLVLITSAPDHERQRRAIRLTWGSFSSRKDVSMGFIVGRTQNPEIQTAIDKENKMYEDVIEAKFIDHYSNLTLKTVSTFHWLKRYCSEVRFILKTDDDMFINVPLLLAFIDTRKSDNYTMYGRLAKNWAPVRNKKSKYYIDKSIYIKPKYPTFLTGPAYLFTNDVIDNLYNRTLAAPFFKLEDVLITGFVAESLGIRKIGVSHFRNDKMKLSDVCKLKMAISIHMVKYEEQFDIYKKTLDGKTKCKKR